jgi:hypothetical protein
MHHLAGHPNVVTLRGAYEDKHHVHIVMEVCQGGELFDRIVERGKYTERDAAEAIRTIVKVRWAVWGCYWWEGGYGGVQPAACVSRGGRCASSGRICSCVVRVAVVQGMAAMQQQQQQCRRHNRASTKSTRMLVWRYM